VGGIKLERERGLVTLCMDEWGFHQEMCHSGISCLVRVRGLATAERSGLCSGNAVEMSFSESSGSDDSRKLKEGSFWG
jgi:hypothetical protein